MVVVSERPVPSAIDAAMDVRWADDDSVWIAASKAGVWELPVGSDTAPKVVIPGEQGAARRPHESESVAKVWLALRLARSASHVAVSPSVFSIAWRSLPGSTLHEDPFDVTVDLDVFDDRLVVLGALKDDQDRFAHDGAIAWTGKLTPGLEELEPVYYSVAGSGAKPMADCSLCDLGAVRFLGDGSFVIAPGVEPGILWYDSSGNLERAWESEQFGLDVSPPNRPERIARDPEARYDWINQSRMIDDILPLPSAPGLLLREHVEGTTRWDLRILHRDGGVTAGEIPLTAGRTGHMKGDVRGNRIALLVVEYGKYGPAATPRLIVAELRP